MPWDSYIACFFAGAFLANAVPHFVKGVTGEPFPTPFAKTGVEDRGPREQVFVHGVEDRGPREQVFVHGVETRGPREQAFVHGVDRQVHSLP
jgi:hypothetical protein